MKRMFAWCAIFMILAAFIALIYFTATGASANLIMASVFCMIVFPVMAYAFIWYADYLKKKKETEKED